MPIITWETAEHISRSGDADGFAKRFVNEKCGAEKLEMHISAVGAGKRAHAAHEHDDEEIVFILSGEATVMIGGEKSKVGSNAAIFAPPGVPHGIENSGDEPLKYMIIRTK